MIFGPDFIENSVARAFDTTNNITMDKFLVRKADLPVAARRSIDGSLLVTPGPATARKANLKRTIERIASEESEDEQEDEHHGDTANLKRASTIESITEESEDEQEDGDDENYDLDEAGLNECTQAYCTQADLIEYDDEISEDDGMTITHDFTQQEEDFDIDEAAQVLLHQEPRRESFHKDTEQQVSIDVMGTQRIFKLGESFKANVQAGWLCKENAVPKGVMGAIYTIRKFYMDSQTMKKTADCRVRIPIYDSLATPSERLRLRRLYPNELVTLAKTERIELKKLTTLVSSKPIVGGDLLFSFEGRTKYSYKLSFEEPPTMAKSFYMLPDFTTPTVLELFAGAGGMSTGFTRAGFDVRWMVEMDPQAAATLKLNHQHGGARVFAERTESFLRKAQAGTPCYPTPNEVHHVHASSPCQGTYCICIRVSFVEF